MVGIMFIIMLALIFVGVPVAFSILGSGIWFLLATDMKPLALVCQRAVTGLDPLHLGMIFVINLVIGYVTPPFGYNLFTACSVTGLKFNQVVKGVLPFLLIEMAAVMLFAYVPSLTTWLPDLLAGS